MLLSAGEQTFTRHDVAVVGSVVWWLVVVQTVEIWMSKPNGRRIWATLHRMMLNEPSS